MSAPLGEESDAAGSAATLRAVSLPSWLSPAMVSFAKTTSASPAMTERVGDFAKTILFKCGLGSALDLDRPAVPIPRGALHLDLTEVEDDRTIQPPATRSQPSQLGHRARVLRTR
jgi:hypothetical protein